MCYIIIAYKHQSWVEIVNLFSQSYWTNTVLNVSNYGEFMNFYAFFLFNYVSQEKTVNAAMEAKMEMAILVLGVGDWIDTYELMSIASDPHEDTLFYVSNFDQLGDKLSDLSRLLCEGILACYTRTLATATWLLTGHCDLVTHWSL